MLRIVTFLALTIYQVSSGAVELLPTAQVAPVAAVAPVAPVAPAIVTARSSQYITQNYNALAAPVVAPAAAIAQYAAIAPAAASYSQFTRYAAPIAQYAVAPAVAPVAAPVVAAAAAPAIASPVLANYVAPAAASYSQVARYAAPIAQYVAASAPFVASASLVAPVAPLVSKAAPLLASPAAPLLANPAAVVARAPLAVASAQPVAIPQQPLAQPLQPGSNPPVQAQNTDDESIEIESARIRSLPQARGQPQQNLAALQQQQGAPVARFQSFPAPQNLPATRQLQQQPAPQQTARLSAGPLPQGRTQQPLNNVEPSGRNLAQQPQQGIPENRAAGAAPGLLSAQQYVQGPYL